MLNKNVLNFQSFGFITIIFQNANYSFNKCIFTSFFNASIISAESVDASLRFYQCCFDSITGDKSGGCIHANCLQNAFYLSLDKVFAVKCQSVPDCSFSKVVSKGNVDIIDIVLSECAPKGTSVRHAYRMEVNKFSHNGGNITECFSYSDVVMLVNSDSFVSWCQFKNNTCEVHGILIGRSNKTDEVRCVTFMYNKNLEPILYGAVLFAYYSNIFSAFNCYFLKNEGGFLIACQKTTSCIVRDCCIDNTNVFNLSIFDGITSSGTIPPTVYIDRIQLFNQCSSISSSNTFSKIIIKYFCIWLDE